MTRAHVIWPAELNFSIVTTKRADPERRVKQIISGHGSNGFKLASVCKVYWQLLLAQGVLMGLGNGLLFVTSISLLSQYFTIRKSFATGVASLGSSIGQ